MVRHYKNHFMGEGVSVMSKIINVNTRYYPSQEKPEDPPPTTAVLVEGVIGDYACYVGHGNAEWVARHGNKISFQEASVQFTGIKRENYRD